MSPPDPGRTSITIDADVLLMLFGDVCQSLAALQLSLIALHGGLLGVPTDPDAIRRLRGFARDPFTDPDGGSADPTPGSILGRPGGFGENGSPEPGPPSKN